MGTLRLGSLGVQHLRDLGGYQNRKDFKSFSPFSVVRVSGIANKDFEKFVKLGVK